jgi:hypothetical protein
MCVHSTVLNAGDVLVVKRWKAKVGQACEMKGGVRMQEDWNDLQYLCSFDTCTRNFVVACVATEMDVCRAALWTIRLSAVSLVQAALEKHAELEGCTFQEAHFRFPDVIVLGTLKGEKMQLCPPGGYIIRKDDELLLLRPSGSKQV